MKKILVFLMVLAVLVTTCVSVFAEEPEKIIPCMVTANRVNERLGPSKRYDSVCQHNKGEIVNVVDTSGTWWQLSNGHYMHSKYLEPMCSNDVDPEVETIPEETVDPSVWLVVDEPDFSECIRKFNFAVASPGVTKEDIVPVVHNCVLLITREQCIECYQNDQMVLRISLVLSTPYVKFAVSEVEGVVYEVRYIRDVAALVQNYSTDDTYFVVID